MEAWINPSDVAARGPLFEWNDGITGWGVHFWIDPGSFNAGPGALYANIVDTGGFWHQLHSPAGAVSSNTFQHVALTYDKAVGMATIYCNGVGVAQAILGSFTPLTTFDLYLGRRVMGAPGDVATFSGLIDEPAIYNRALTAAEITTIYNAGSAGKCVPRIQCLPDLISVPANTSTNLAAAKLTLNDLDLDGYALTVINVSSNSAQGGTVTLISGQVTYTPPANLTGNDAFTYSVSDGHGGAASGTVTATVGSGGGPSQNLIFGPAIVGNSLVFHFAGIPGLTYTIEAAASLSGPWAKVTNLTAPATDQGLGVGVFAFQIPLAGASQFYRTVYPAY